MSVRCGHILRDQDVHGVSGTGKVADVFEATNGKCIVVWISAHSSTNIYDNVKHVESTHSHGGKTNVVWDWESPPDPDPMDALEVVEKPTLTEEEMEEIAAEAAEVANKKVVDKIAEKMAETPDLSEKDVKEVKKSPKKAAAKKSAKKKD